MRILPATSLMILGLLAGCSALPASAERKKTTGALKVYTAQAWGTVGDSPMSYLHTEYDVTTPDGRFVTRERNVDERTERSPVSVSLPIGSYVVIAQAKGRGKVEVPVKIEAGRLTELHFDKPQSGELTCTTPHP